MELSHILLKQFTSDPIERAFDKLRQGSGGKYVIIITSNREIKHK